MEFSDLGSHCEYENCGKQDYLPFKCDLCLKTFCLEHKSYDSHQCFEYNKPKILVPKNKKTPHSKNQNTNMTYPNKNNMIQTVSYSQKSIKQHKVYKTKTVFSIIVVFCSFFWPMMLSEICCVLEKQYKKYKKHIKNVYKFDEKYKKYRNSNYESQIAQNLKSLYFS